LAAQWDGDPEEFVEALIYGGFIDRDGDELVLHDWYDYAGKLIGKRLEERERSRRRRQQAKKETETTAGETAEPTAGRPADDQRSTVGTVPYRTVPNSTIDSNSVAKRFDDDSIPMKLAMHLKKEILNQDPSTKVPDDLTNWATEADRMIRLDKRDPREAAHLITWAQNDSFWRANILSMGKFRKQYDTLKRQAVAQNQTRHPPKRDGETTAQRMLREEMEREQGVIIDIGELIS